MQKITTLIVSGGDLESDFLKNFINNVDINCIIAVDKGLEKLHELNILPSHIIGDFDSVNKTIIKKYKDKQINIIKLNTEKDFSDTHMALKLAIELKSTNIYIVRSLRQESRSCHC